MSDHSLVWTQLSQLQTHGMADTLGVIGRCIIPCNQAWSSDVIGGQTARASSGAVGHNAINCTGFIFGVDAEILGVCATSGPFSGAGSNVTGGPQGPSVPGCAFSNAIGLTNGLVQG